MSSRKITRDDTSRFSPTLSNGQLVAKIHCVRHTATLCKEPATHPSPTPILSFTVVVCARGWSALSIGTPRSGYTSRIHARKVFAFHKMPTFLRLELENFKSYRTPTTIEWKQVSSIIGQNGTGSLFGAICFIEGNVYSISELTVWSFFRDPVSSLFNASGML